MQEACVIYMRGIRIRLGRFSWDESERSWTLNAKSTVVMSFLIGNINCDPCACF